MFSCRCLFLWERLGVDFGSEPLGLGSVPLAGMLAPTPCPSVFGLLGPFSQGVLLGSVLCLLVVFSAGKCGGLGSPWFDSGFLWVPWFRSGGFFLLGPLLWVQGTLFPRVTRFCLLGFRGLPGLQTELFGSWHMLWLCWDFVVLLSRWAF